jgi:hypothetical protein
MAARASSGFARCPYSNPGYDGFWPSVNVEHATR